MNSTPDSLSLFAYLWTITNHMLSIIPNGQWLSAGALLFLSSVGLVSDQIYWRKILKILQPIGSKGRRSWPIISKRILTKYTRTTRSSGVLVRYGRKNYECQGGVCLKTCRDPFLELDLSMHVNKTPFHLVTQSLYAFRPENIQFNPVLNQEVLGL